MKTLIDLIIINFSAVGAFIYRENFGDFITRQAPSVFGFKYAWTLLSLNILYLFISWIAGLYDRRQKRALLEEFILLFGIVSTSIAVLVAVLFLGRMWWVSRTILYLFWGLSIVLLSLSRLFMGTKTDRSKISKVNLVELESTLARKRKSLDIGLKKILSIIIVNYNNRENLSFCLDSLRRADLRNLTEIIVVDNNSSDGSVDFIKQNYPEVKIITYQQNLGYSRAVNGGLRSAVSDFCLILNPDVIVIPGTIEVMLNFAIEHPKVGILGCKLLNEDGSLQYSARRFLDLRTYLYRFTPLRGLMAGSALERFYLMQDWEHKDNCLVDWVLGGSMMVRVAAVKEVGMMEEAFFLYFEDVDWCYRMWEKGWQVAYVAEAAMFHKHVRSSANKIFDRATYEHFKSLFCFLRKHGLRLPQKCPSVQQ